MTFAYPAVLIDSQPYTVYADETDADLYLMASITAATSWAAATATVQAQSLVSSTRWLDTGTWLGHKTDAAQEHAFPRTGLTYADGTAVDPNSLPISLVDACIELAALLNETPDLRTTFQAPLAKDLKAGSASITYFRPQQVQNLAQFPVTIMPFIKLWLTGPVSGSVAPRGVHDKPKLPHDLGFQHGL